ncbi:hypothetical protein [Bifidobacterium catulorum]|nr:hypothetical protein [Bifidobacterium catulorum]
MADNQGFAEEQLRSIAGDSYKIDGIDWDKDNGLHHREAGSDDR